MNFCSYFFILTVVLHSQYSSIAEAKVTTQSWKQSLREKKIYKVIVCGDENIQTTKKSLEHNFFMDGKGYLFNNLITSSEFWNVLKTEDTEKAKQKLSDLFKASELLEVDEKSGLLTNLGNPSSIQLDFKQSVKSCVEIGENSRGSNHCKNLQIAEREQCCMEKFVTPLARWGQNEKEFKLFFEPGSGVRLSVAGERRHRFCQVHQRLDISK